MAEYELPEFQAMAMLLKSKDVKPTFDFSRERKTIKCFACKTDAISVCNFSSGKGSTQGCRRPFCLSHSRLVHRQSSDGFEPLKKDQLEESYSMADLREEQAELLGIEEGPGASTKEMRLCSECNLEVLFGKQASLASFCSARLSLTVLLLFLAFVFGVSKLPSQVPSSLMELQQNKLKAAVCLSNEVYVAELGACFEVRKSSRKHNLTLSLWHAEYRTGTECSFWFAEMMECKCPLHSGFVRETLVCRTLSCRADEFLGTTGTCYDRYKMVPETGCPMFSRRSSNFKDDCINSQCPRSYQRTPDGGCVSCLPYESANDVQGCHIQKTDPKYAHLQGFRSKKCEVSEDGEKISFFDELGQLQCPNSTYIHPPSASPKPSCEKFEILNKDLLGCQFACPEGFAYNFFKRECIQKQCAAYQTLSADGQCVNPSPYLPRKP